MSWSLAARTVAAVHVAYVAFVMLGSLVVLVVPWLLWVHLLAVAWAVATMCFDLACPLTPWEKSFWRRAGREPYEEGFLQHHVLRTRFDPANARRNHILLGIGALAVNLAIYWFLLP